MQNRELTGEVARLISNATVAPVTLLLCLLLIWSSDFDSSANAYLLVLFGALVLPNVLLLPIVKRNGDLHFSARRSRVVPFLLLGVFAVLDSIALQRADSSELLRSFLLVYMVLILVLALVTAVLQFKISVHMTTTGALTGVVFALGAPLEGVPVLIASAVVAWARRASRLLQGGDHGHSVGEIVVGFATGVIVPILLLHRLG